MLRHCYAHAKNSCRSKPLPLSKLPPAVMLPPSSPSLHYPILPFQAIDKKAGTNNPPVFIIRYRGPKVTGLNLGTIFQNIRGTSFQDLNIMKFITTHISRKFVNARGMNIERKIVLCEVRTGPSSRFVLVF
jgi:hypothetical protein